MNLLAIFPHEAWAMDPVALRALRARAAAVAELAKCGLRPDAQASSPRERQGIVYNGGNPIVPEIEGAVATIELFGEFIARAPWFAKGYLGVIDPYDVADAIDALAGDSRVTSLVIEMDSCGGTVNGTAEMAAAMTRFQAAGKTVEVRAAGTLASAAYFFACGADRIVVTRTTRTGSCGTMQILEDSTGAQAAAGITEEVISTGPLKGIGADGRITPALRAFHQRLVDGWTAIFRDAVAAGRGLAGAALDAAFTGDIWLADQALAMGLIDAIASPADELDQAQGAAPAPDPAPPALEGDDDDDDAEATAGGTPSRAAAPPAPTTPPTPPAGAGGTSPTPSAAADLAQESTMDPKILAAVAALSAKHPTIAEKLAAKALVAGCTVADLEALAGQAEAAAAIAEKDATIATLTAEKTAAAAKATADAAEIARLKQLAGIADATPADPGAPPAGGEGKKRLIPGAKAGNLTQQDLDDIKAGKAMIDYEPRVGALFRRDASGVMGGASPN